jgi:hypothetical protein
LKGSKNCILELVESKDFTHKINPLLKSAGASISIYDNWMPKNRQHGNEAELKDFLKYNFNPALGEGIRKWWLEVDATTPNWDLISTCTIDGKRGLLLVEAKAHHWELENEAKKKSLATDASKNSESNHRMILNAINEANTAISSVVKGTKISGNKCYQLSNRIAHAWWLASHGIPTVLLYLGFLNVNDMNDGKNRLFQSHDEWEACFRNHIKIIEAEGILNNSIDCGLSSFITICKSMQL